MGVKITLMLLHKALSKGCSRGGGIKDYFFLVGFFFPSSLSFVGGTAMAGHKGCSVLSDNHGLRFLRYAFASGSPLQGTLHAHMNELVMPPMAREALFSLH